MSVISKTVLVRGNTFIATLLIACTAAGNASGVIVPHKAGARIALKAMSVTPLYNAAADASGVSSDAASQLAADVPIFPNISLTIDAPANPAHAGVDWVYAAFSAIAAAPQASKRLDFNWAGVGLVMGSPDDLQITAGYKAASDIVTAAFILQVNISGVYLPFVAGNTLNEQWLLPTYPDLPITGITMMGHVYVAEDYFSGTTILKADPVTALAGPLFPRAYVVNPGTAAAILQSYAQAGLATDTAGAPLAAVGVGTFDVAAQYTPPPLTRTPPPTHIYQSLEAGTAMGASTLDAVLGGLQLNPADILTIQASTTSGFGTDTDVYVWAQSFTGSFNQFGQPGTYL